MINIETGSYYVYIVRCRDNTLYTGATNNVLQRIARHNKGKGAKYTRSRGPVELVWARTFPTWLEAAREERRIKKLTRKAKEALIDNRE